jgi:UDP-N-acetylmuramoyl-tripeptide--D-alanyl-D-alanine ligase
MTGQPHRLGFDPMLDDDDATAFLSAEAMREATRGRWLRPPSDRCRPTGVSLDTRDIVAGHAFVALKGERFDAHDFCNDAVRAGATLLIVERPPSGLDMAALPDGVAVLEVQGTRTALADLARAWRSLLTETQVIAVTGSAGKTTTRRLIEAVLATQWKGSASPKSFNNDIGVPYTILAARRDHRFLVLEIGMNHPGEIIALAEIARPHIAVITMVGRVHLEGLGSLEAIAAEKSSILRALEPGGLAIVNGDGAVLNAAAAAVWRSRKGLVPGDRFERFGVSGTNLDLRLTGRTVTPRGQRIEVNREPLAELQLPGEHNATNALAAVAVGRALGVSTINIRHGLESVAPANMRLERVERQGIVFFNDAYNANPDAVAASMRAFAELTPGSGRRVIVLGDMLELGAAAADLHREVGQVAGSIHQSTPLAAVVAVGRHAGDTRDGLLATGFSGVVRTYGQLDAEATTGMRELLRAGDRVLLKGSRGSAMERVLTAMGEG